MKNIHVLPTDKPSRLYEYNNKLFIGEFGHNLNKNIYITNDEKIKEGDWFLNTKSKAIGQHNGSKILLFKDDKKIILTTDADLIKEGVQAIDNEFLEWFINNPSCDSVDVESMFNMVQFTSREFIHKIIIPKEEPNQDIIMELQKDPLLKDFDNQVNKKISFLKQKQETLEEVAEKYSKKSSASVFQEAHKRDFIAGAKWQQEQDKKLYSEEEVNEIIAEAWNSCEDNEGETFTEARKRIIEQFKKK